MLKKVKISDYEISSTIGVGTIFATQELSGECGW
jgi:hypothetical protein